MKCPTFPRTNPGTVVYGLLLSLFALHQLGISADIRFPFADNWLDDLLALPILLPAIGWVRKKRGWSDRVILPGLHILFAIALTAFWFEIIAPVGFHRGTSDLWDVAAYLTGALGVWMWGKIDNRISGFPIKNDS